MRKGLAAILFALALLTAAQGQETINQKITRYEQQLTDPNLTPSLKEILQARIESLNKIKAIEAQLSAAKNFKSSLGDLSADESAKIDAEIKALEERKAELEGTQAEAAEPRSPEMPSTASQVSVQTSAITNAISTEAVQSYAKRVARSAITSPNPDDLSGVIERLKVFIIAAAIDPDSASRVSGDPLGLLASQTIVRFETARTDKQVGASASGDGTTSLLERPSISNLLGFALEHGAVDKEVSGTALTLTSSPYAIIAAFSGGDTQHNYYAYAPFRVLGASATFNVANQDNPDPTLVSRQQLSEWSAKIRLTPDRSTRSRAFEHEWFTNKDLKKFDAEPLAYLKLKILIAKSSPTVQKEINGLEDDWSWVPSFIATNKELSDVELQNKLATEILARLNARIGQVIGNKTLGISLPDLRAALFQLQAGQEQHGEAVAAFDELAKNFASRFNASIEYSNSREPMLSDISAIKLLLDKHIAGELMFTANAAANFYHRPNPMLNQDTFRSFSAAMSFEKSFGRSPFVIAKDDESPISATLSGRYQRMPEYAGRIDKKADIGAISFKIEIPIASAITLPFSVTYATAADQQELKAKDFVRGNFGLTFDFDKLYTLLHPPK